MRDILRGLAAAKQHPRRASRSTRRSAASWSTPRRLKQILYNYLSNAHQVHARRRPGHGARRARRGRRLPARGRGHRHRHRAEDLDRLFVEFQQLDASAAKRYPGTGLGLALTKRIVEAQGGASACAARRPGQHVLRDPSPSRRLGRPAHRVGEPWREERPMSAGEPILIVDDNPANLKLARVLLAAEGYDVRTAATPRRRWRCSRPFTRD